MQWKDMQRFITNYTQYIDGAAFIRVNDLREWMLEREEAEAEAVAAKLAVKSVVEPIRGSE